MGSDSVGKDKYLLAINKLANKVWKAYPEIVDICIEDAKNFRSVTLKNGLTEHITNMGQPRDNFWYDSRLSIMAMNRKSWLNTELFDFSPNKDEIKRIKIASVPKFIRWLTPQLTRLHMEEVTELAVGLEFVKELNPVSFVWNDREETGKHGVKDFGFIAQDLKSTQEKYEMAETLGLVYEENPEKLEASYGKLIPILVQAIKELSAKVEALENK